MSITLPEIALSLRAETNWCATARSPTVTKYSYTPTGRERHFGKDEVIVSKTDPKGKITYGNDVFERMAGYSEAEYLGAPHSILRHPDMPRCVFKLLWDRIAA
ncbi:MAG: PAS domain-containing protein, partial [Alphaproteobacteria bacterium]|nr:PAS domain-containing protein [Alphaproteobacteria bacterium]